MKIVFLERFVVFYYTIATESESGRTIAGKVKSSRLRECTSLRKNLYLSF